MDTFVGQISPISTQSYAEAQTAASTCRLGHISFINSLPLLVPLTEKLVELRAQIIVGSPSELNDAYDRGEIDLGAMSSFHFLKSGNMLLMPSVSISAKGPVGSVLLFSKKPIESLDGGTIGLTAQSASSANLLKVLLFDQTKVRPRFVTVEQMNLDDAAFDAMLVIGDKALAVDGEWSQKFHRYDLAEWWHKSYGLPFVFGLWAARGSWVKNNVAAFQQISTSLRQALDIGLTTALPQVIAEAHKRSGLSEERLRHYFLKELNFDFCAEHLEGLARYAHLCQEYGLL